jgi:O-antigen/teichoic acid export membrane protein
MQILRRKAYWLKRQLRQIKRGIVSTYTSSANRIAKNTLMLYFRQILIMLVNLYAVRVILETLGAVDYGIYTVVAGVVTMFTFLSGAMAHASQRYFSFELGQKNYEQLKKTFSVSFIIYVFLALGMLLLAETVSLWFVHNKLVIPPERVIAARWVYQTTVVSFVFTLLTTPYMAAIIAHEDMDIYAYVSIFEAVLKLGVVFLLVLFEVDLLILYGFLMMIVTIINTSIYRTVCKKKYPETKVGWIWDTKLFRELFSFTGWSIFGAFTTITRVQVITILINQFFNPIVVAARSIATQVSSALNVFASGFNTSLYAPIVKEYAADNKEQMFSLIFNGCKMTFFLMWIFALPLLLRMEYVLAIWLKNIPDYVVVFTKLSIYEVLINSVSLPIMTAARASGKVKLYELTLGSLQLLIIISSYIWIKFFQGEAVVVFYTAIIINVVMFFARLFIVQRLVGLPLRKYLYKVLAPVFIIIGITSLLIGGLNNVLPQNFISLCGVVFFSVILSSVLMSLVGLDKNMKIKIKNKILGMLL